MTKYSLLFLFAFVGLRSFGQSVTQDTLLRWLKESKELYSTGDYANSAELAWACVKAAQQQQLPAIAGKAYTLLARGAFQLQDIKQGLEYGRAGCNALLRAGQSSDLGEAFTVMSIFMLATEQLDSAYYYSQQAVQTYHQAGDPLGEAIAYSKMGHVFNLKGEYAKATPYYLRCFELSRHDTLSMAYMTANLSLASNYIYLKQPGAALLHNRKAYATAKALNSFYELSTALHYFSGIYEMKGDFASALQYERQYADVRDSVLNAERVRQVKKLEIQYQTAEKESAIQLLEKNKSQQRIVLWAVLATLALLTLVAVQIYRSYRRRTSDNRILAAANTSLEAEKIRTELQLEAEGRERERLKEIDAFKSRFFTNITHEFRTPLTVILGMAGRLEATLAEAAAAGKAEQQTAIALIKRNGQNLLRLINEILDLAKLENNSLKINYVQGDALGYLRYIAESMHSLANTRNVLLRVESNHASIIMDYDPERLLQIAHNLLSNAIKFTPSGGRVLLKINVLTDTAPPGEPLAERLCITVSDTGAGIAAADLPHLFDRFFQANNQDHANSGGTGIGLSLTRELVKIMGGEMEVESTLGKGATFRVYLPIQRQASLATESMPVVTAMPVDTAPSDVVRPNAEPLSDNQILIIEDNPDVVEYLAACLGPQYQLDFAYNGRSGIEKALETIPDLIISDVMMPEKDGYEVCNTLKNDERTSHVPLILLTAKATAADRIAGLRRGADAYLAKPFVEEELSVVIRNLLDTRQKLQAKYRHTGAGPEPSAPVPDAPSAPVVDLENVFLKKTIDLIEANIESIDYGNTELARHMLMSESQLHRKIKALTGQSLSLFIRSVRLRRGRYLLESTDMNVSEVAYATGFSDPAYFSRTFSAEFGVAPTAVRKNK